MISVVLYVRDDERISAVIDSVLSNTYQDYELMIFSDLKIKHSNNKKIKKYSLNDTYKDKINGDYVVILNDNVFVYDKYLQELYECISNNNEDWAMCDYKDVVEEENMINFLSDNKFNKLYNSNLSHNVFKKELIENLSDDLNNDYENKALDFIINLLNNNYKPYKLDKVLVNYYYDSDFLKDDSFEQRLHSTSFLYDNAPIKDKEKSYLLYELWKSLRIDSNLKRKERNNYYNQLRKDKDINNDLDIITNKISFSNVEGLIQKGYYLILKYRMYRTGYLLMRIKEVYDILAYKLMPRGPQFDEKELSDNWVIVWLIIALYIKILIYL